MKTTIYYFSATGNSLNYARKIAEGIGDTELISIPKVIKDEEIRTTSERVGLVIPVYAWGLPRIVADFAKKLRIDDKQYVFAIATNAGVPGGTLKQLNKIVKIDAGFVVRDENHTPLSAEMFIISFVTRFAGKKPKYGKERLQEITATIKEKKKHKLEGSAWAGNLFGSILHGPAVSSFQKVDKDFKVNDRCNFCRTCERVCPRENIKIEEKKHTWKHDCESCFACLNWCPQEAIQFKKDEIKRSHNPNVVLKDVILR